MFLFSSQAKPSHTRMSMYFIGRMIKSGQQLLHDVVAARSGIESQCSLKFVATKISVFHDKTRIKSRWKEFEKLDLAYKVSSALGRVPSILKARAALVAFWRVTDNLLHRWDTAVLSNCPVCRARAPKSQNLFESFRDNAVWSFRLASVFECDGAMVAWRSVKTVQAALAIRPQL